MKLRGKFKLLRLSAREVEDVKETPRIYAPWTEQGKPVSGYVIPQEVVKTLTAVATNAWRAKTKMADAVTGEIREDLKRVGRHIEAIYRNLAELGVVIRDHTGEAYDEGQPMKVVATKPSPGLEKKRISETLLPSIFWNDHLIQNGEIEIAVPVSDDNSSQPKEL